MDTNATTVSVFPVHYNISDNLIHIDELMTEKIAKHHNISDNLIHIDEPFTDKIDNSNNENILDQLISNKYRSHGGCCCGGGATSLFDFLIAALFIGGLLMVFDLNLNINNNVNNNNNNDNMNMNVNGGRGFGLPNIQSISDRTFTWINQAYKSMNLYQRVVTQSYETIYKFPDSPDSTIMQ